MTKIDNFQQIEEIRMYPRAFTKCEIGGDWYENDLEIVMRPSDCYPDYMEVQDWVMKNIDGKTLNIEDVVNDIYEFIDTEYHPYSVNVIDSIKGCKTHFDVIVKR